MEFTLTLKERKDALESLLFITEKRNSDVRARKVTDGSKQRTYDKYNNSDGSSPTVPTYSVFLTGVVDAHEKRAVMIINIANTFLHATNDENVLMLLQVKLAKIMVKVDPSMYRKYIK